MPEVWRSFINSNYWYETIAFHSSPGPGDRENYIETTIKYIEDLGYIFKGDPTFDYIFNHLPKSYFTEIVKIRKQRMLKEPSLGNLVH